MPLLGTKSTAEEVRLRQPDTENHQDPDEMSDEEPSPAAGDGALLQSSPKTKATPKVDVSTRTVTLKSSGSAGPDNADVTDLPDKPRANSSSAKPGDQL